MLLILYCRENLLLKYSSTWKPIHIINAGAMIALNRNEPDVPLLSHYAAKLFERMKQMRLLNSQSIQSPRDVCAAIIEMESPADVNQEIENCFEKLKAAGLEGVGNSLLRLMVRKYSLEMDAGPASSPDMAVAVEEAIESSNCGPEARRASKRPRSDDSSDFDVAERTQLKAMKTTEQKLELIQKIHAQYNSAGRPVNQYCSALKKLTYLVINPIMACLSDHCQNDPKEFERRWGSKFNHTDWGKKHCPGPNPEQQSCGWRSEQSQS